MGYTWTVYLLDPDALLDALAGPAHIAAAAAVTTTDPHARDLAAGWATIGEQVRARLGQPGRLTEEQGFYVVRMVEALGRHGATVPHSTPAGDEFREHFLGQWLGGWLGAEPVARLFCRPLAQLERQERPHLGWLDAQEIRGAAMAAVPEDEAYDDHLWAVVDAVRAAVRSGCGLVSTYV